MLYRNGSGAREDRRPKAIRLLRQPSLARSSTRPMAGATKRRVSARPGGEGCCSSDLVAGIAMAEGNLVRPCFGRVSGTAGKCFVCFKRRAQVETLSARCRSNCGMIWQCPSGASSGEDRAGPRQTMEPSWIVVEITICLMRSPRWINSKAASRQGLQRQRSGDACATCAIQNIVDRVDFLVVSGHGTASGLC